MIGGTSTGGILAYLLGVKKLSVEKCEELYLSLASTIFASRWMGKAIEQINSGGLAAHDSQLLESFAKLHLGEESLSNFEQNSPLVIVTIVNVNFTDVCSCCKGYKSIECIFISNLFKS